MKLGKALTVLFLVIPMATGWTGSFAAGQTLAELEEQAVWNAVAQVADSVVRIETLGGLEQVNGTLVGTGPTTGVCVSEDGYIISSTFNFVRRPTSILVTLPGGTRVPAQIIAHDRSRMLVLLKVELDQKLPVHKLPVPKMAPRNELAVGQWSMAIGRAYSADSPNISVGILSATNRIWGRAVQTDAKISPGNYGGPLIDIKGRVIGILVPLSPQKTGELAGAEWYDSGIGFAVPFEDIFRRLDDLKSGKDLHRGILGVSFKGPDIYSTAATIAACPAKSPAHEGGFRPGDTIVEVNGQKIERRAQLQHALGPHYAGDRIHVVAVRGPEAEKIEATVELAAKLDPYVRPFLGILPERNSGGSEKGVKVRFVFPDSPASNASLQPGDRLIAIGDKPIEHATALREAVAGMNPNDEISIRFQRQDRTESVNVILARVPTTIPAKLPVNSAGASVEASDEQPTGIVKITVPEEPNTCVAYVPENYNPARLYGLLVWLPTPGDADGEKLIGQWKASCTSSDFILLAPQSRDGRRWLPTEVEYVQKTVDDIVRRYSIDAAHIAVCGQGVSGTMAYLVAFANRDMFRGIASVGGTLPRRIQAPTTDPLQPLAVFSISFSESPTAQRVLAGDKLLGKLGFPVSSREISGTEQPLTDQHRDELVRWFDSLDRI